MGNKRVYMYATPGDIKKLNELQAFLGQSDSLILRMALHRLRDDTFIPERIKDIMSRKTITETITLPTRTITKSIIMPEKRAKTAADLLREQGYLTDDNCVVSDEGTDEDWENI